MIWDISFFNRIYELLPPDKRTVRHYYWLQSLGFPIEYLNNKFFTDYKVGSPYALWVAGVYAKSDKVIYEKRVYESLVDGNTDNPISSKWFLYQNTFIGSDDRVKYNGQKVVLEYALNQYYSTTFRQPNLLSDIYIETLGYTLNGFRVAKTFGSTVGQTTSSDYIGSLSPFLLVNNFKIWFPTAVYAITTEAEVRNFVDPIIPKGLKYTIETY
jgi:hypothetical protein